MDPERLELLLNGSADDDLQFDLVNELRPEAGDWGNPPEWANNEAVLEILTQLASDPSEGSLHLDAAEALALVWLLKGAIDLSRFRRLSTYAQDEVRAYVEVNRSELLNEFADRG